MNRIPKDKTQKTNKEVNFHTNFPVLSGVLSHGSGEHSRITKKKGNED
jgi:hypothetical protein